MQHNKVIFVGIFFSATSGLARSINVYLQYSNKCTNLSKVGGKIYNNVRLLSTVSWVVYFHPHCRSICTLERWNVPLDTHYHRSTFSYVIDKIMHNTNTTFIWVWAKLRSSLDSYYSYKYTSSSSYSQQRASTILIRWNKGLMFDSSVKLETLSPVRQCGFS